MLSMSRRNVILSFKVLATIVAEMGSKKNNISRYDENYVCDFDFRVMPLNWDGGNYNFRPTSTIMPQI